MRRMVLCAALCAIYPAIGEEPAAPRNERLENMLRANPTGFEARKAYIEQCLAYGAELEANEQNLSAMKLYQRGLSIWLNHPVLLERVRQLKRPLVDRPPKPEPPKETKPAEEITPAERAEKTEKPEKPAPEKPPGRPSLRPAVRPQYVPHRPAVREEEKPPAPAPAPAAAVAPAQPQNRFWIPESWLVSASAGIVAAVGIILAGILLLLGYTMRLGRKDQPRTQPEPAAASVAPAPLAIASREEDPVQLVMSQRSQIATQSLRSLAAYVDNRGLRAHHTETVCQVAGFIARRLNLSPEIISDVQQAALVMDLGMIESPEYVFSKAEELTEDEWEVMREHPENSLELVQSAGFKLRIRNAIASHHERWDGSGYPLGLSGQAIPLEARILGVADTFVSLSSPRPYRPVYTRAQSLIYVKRHAGQLFDPRIVKALYAGVIEKAKAAAGQKAGHNQKGA
jgi:hypothetical protein